MVMATCLKCGAEAEAPNAFCPKCLEVLAATPVKPGTVAHVLPRPKRAEVTPDTYQASEDQAQLALLRRKLRWLVAVTLILSALLLVTAGMLTESILAEPEVPAIGRNYTTTQQP